MISLPAILYRRGEGHPSLSVITCANDTYPGYSVDYHPSTEHIAAGYGGSGTGAATVWSFDGSTLTKVDTAPGLSTSIVYQVKWSPDGNFLAVGFSSGGVSLKIYAWNGTNLTEVTSVNPGSGVRDIDWHPSGNFLCCTYGVLNGIKVYSWDGVSSLTLIQTLTTGSYSLGYPLEWSPDGNYLAVESGTVSSVGTLVIYNWSGSLLTTVAATYSNPPASQPFYLNNVDWSSDGTKIFCGYYSMNNTANNYDAVVALSFNGSALNKLDGVYNITPSIGTTTNVWILRSQLDGYLFTSVGDSDNAGSTPIIGAYTWDGSTLSLSDSLSTSKHHYEIALSPSNKYLVRSMRGSSTFCVYSTGLHL